jgi:hypothetical protein
LKEKYADQWTDPVDGAVPSEDQSDDWIIHCHPHIWKG